jgi:hypothetical protein
MERGWSVLESADDNVYKPLGDKYYTAQNIEVDRGPRFAPTNHT